MLQKLKDYWLIISSLLLAILGILLYSRQSELRDVRAQIINKKADDKIKEAETNYGKSSQEYREKKRRYEELKRKYENR